jgi:putative ABC transport system ATP-binding protein
MNVITMEKVTRYYQVGQIETPALRGVDLTIEDGEFSAVVGPSGSGKTTLLQLMGCLDKPTGGRIFIKGEDVTQLNASQRADLRKGTIGFIFQFFALIPGLTAYENVEMPLLLSGAKKDLRSDRVKELLEAVGLSDRSHHRPDQMSGGEQQRVAIARALSTRPAVVLADEPTANLDGDTGQQVMEIMERLNKETGTTFFFATHDPRVLPFVHRTIVLRDGLVAENNKNSNHKDT